MKNQQLTEIFQTQLIDELVSLGDDPVSNVRIVLASVLKKHFQSSGPYVFDLKINSLVKILKKDKTRDVANSVKDLQTFPLNETSDELEVSTKSATIISTTETNDNTELEEDVADFIES